MIDLLYLFAFDPLSPALYWYGAGIDLLLVIAYFISACRRGKEISLLHIVLSGVLCFMPGLNMIVVAFGMVVFVMVAGCWLDSVVVFGKKE